MEYNVNGYGKDGIKGVKENKSHKLIVAGRKESIISGVTEVNEFDNNTVSLDTVMGRLIIKGRELKVKALNLETGEAEVEGNVDSLCYTTKQSGESFLKKMFK